MAEQVEVTSFLHQQYNELKDEFAVLELEAQDLKAHRDELYQTLDEYTDILHDLRADVAELTAVGLEALEAMEEADRDAEAYGHMVKFYMLTLHTISAYGGQDASIPAGIARAAIASNLIPVQLDPETGEVSNVQN